MSAATQKRPGPKREAPADGSKMFRLVVEISQADRAPLKIRAAQEGTTLRSHLIKLIREDAKQHRVGR
jgi:hypothetical protein